MRIGIGALVGIVGGPATYARELVGALARLGGHNYVVFTDQPERFAAIDVERVHVPLATTYHQVTWDHARLPGMVAAHGVALYHGTKNVLPWRLAVPGVVTVHDLAVYACPETFAWPQRLHFRLAVPASVARAARVIADSQHARGDLVARFGLDPARVPVVPLAMSAAFDVPPELEAVAGLRARHGLGTRLIACVGTVQPRKRVERVIEAFGRADGAARGWQLTIAGRLRPGYAPPWLQALPPGVRWLGPLDDEALRALYAAAEIAMTASEYEGFGLTVLEAMASGCAVIAPALTSIPEVAGDAALLVARSDAALLGDALARLFDDPATRASLSERARRRAAEFTWKETARRTRQVYEEVYEEVLG
ncbi:MAG TPA: glycosyltransferase family 1 protein [Candidatus Binatia bacterium]|nr:glycosyltransferase family 1 protein [Candidatus Binatia bacterium]